MSWTCRGSSAEAQTSAGPTDKHTSQLPLWMDVVQTRDLGVRLDLARSMSVSSVERNDTKQTGERCSLGINNKGMRTCI